MKRTRLTLDLVKTLLTTVRPGLREVLKEVKTVDALQKEVADYVAAQGAITIVPPMRFDLMKSYRIALHSVNSNTLIGAIKAVRELTNYGLKEAKDVVDRVYYSGVEFMLFNSADADTCARAERLFRAVNASLSFTEVP